MTKDIQDYILKHGKQYKPAPLPDYIQRGKVGDCFDVCILEAAKNPHLRYVEGMAAHPFEENTWIMHAWLTDGIHAFDPTWGIQKAGEPVKHLHTIYLGIEMDTHAVAEFLKVTEYKSIMANGWRCTHLADRIIPHFPYKKAMR